MEFDRLSVGDGLSQYTVRDITQDRNGILWVATSDGLNSYDGYDFVTYRHSRNDTTSIADSRLTAVETDGVHIWTAAAKWLSEYCPDEGRFHNFQTKSTITSLCYIGDGNLLVGTANGLGLFNPDNGTWQNEAIPEELRSIRINCMIYNGGKLYIGTFHEGVYVLAFKPYKVHKLETPNYNIQDIYCSDAGHIWIATEGNGLLKTDEEGRIIEAFTFSNGMVASDYVRTIASDGSGRIWIGSVKGLNIIENGSIRNFKNNPFDASSLSNDSVRCIFKDSQGGMWLGTFYGGLNYWHERRNHFEKITRKEDGKSLSDNIISCIVEDGSKVWIGTNAGGIDLYDKQTGKISMFQTFVNGEDRMTYDVKDICTTGDGYIYFGAHAGGLRKLECTTGKVALCGARTKGPKDVYCLQLQDDGSILTGSLSGLYSYDRQNDRFTNIVTGGRPAGRVWTLTNDSKGRVWMGTDSGVRVLQRTQDGNFVECMEISNRLQELQHPCCITEGDSLRMWICTTEGLYMYNCNDGSTRSYTCEEGLASDVTHGVEEDSWGRLWIGTDKGLCSLNPYTGQVHNYMQHDGLTSEQFNDYSHCRMVDGEMWFGGMNGITRFRPEKFSDNPFRPAPLITRLSVAGKNVHFTGDSVRLPHDQNSFSLNFAVPNFLAWGGSRFKYTLDGFDKIWHDAGDDRTAVYSNLKPGHYVFRVKAANNDSLWSDKPTELRIQVVPRWYQTLLFKLLVLFLVLASGTAVYKFTGEKRKLQRKIEEDATKTRFFINMSHELRTPLQLILSPIKEMQERTDDRWMKKQLRYLDRNANRLLHLVNQLMDYRRAELGVFKLHVKPEDVHRIVSENFKYFESVAASKRLDYTLDSSVEGQTFLCDEQYLELILNNLLSNAFKYTEHGAVNVKLWSDGENFNLSVSDTGSGVAKDQQSKIFERFYQADGTHLGSGIGLSLVQKLVELHHGSISLESDLGKGARFTVKIPVSDSAYTIEEHISDTTEDKHSINSAEMLANDTLAADEPEAMNAKADRPIVLVVDDEQEFRDYLIQGIEKRFRTETAENGKNALGKIGQEKFDLILTDISMPVMDGKKLCREIRKNSRTANIPVIMISSLSDEESQLEALGCGADDFVTKPFSIPVLMAKMTNLLKSRAKLTASIEGKDGIRETSLNYSQADEAFLEKLLKIINDNIDNSAFSTDELASAMNMSRSNLHLKIKAITGSSTLELIKKVRYGKACEMLRKGDMSVNRISDMVGFTSASYFAASFRKRFGCMPSEYAKLNKI